MVETVPRMQISAPTMTETAAPRMQTVAPVTQMAPLLLAATSTTVEIAHPMVQTVAPDTQKTEKVPTMHTLNGIGAMHNDIMPMPMLTK